MPKKAHKKKARAKRICREQVRSGLINTASGDWTTENKSGAEDAMIRDMRAGYGFRR